jgi:hypothetical protein
MKSMRWYLIFLLGISLNSFAQEKTSSVIATAGDVSKSATMVLEWTVGEPAVETLFSSTALLTQGFHQPILEVQKNNAIKTLTNGKNAAVVYPNPATAIVNVQMEKPLEKPVLVLITDGSGKTLLRNNFPQNSSMLKINLANLSQGTYYLQLIEPEGAILGAYKVIKIQ